MSNLIDNPMKIEAKNVNLFYGQKQALDGIDIGIPEKKVTAFIGPSGCGKSSFLRCLNRMNDMLDCDITGEIRIDNVNIYDKQVDVVNLRKKVGMVFQKPNPFPKSIYENIAYGPRIHEMVSSKKELDEIVVKSLTGAGLFDEVKDRLNDSALSLSGGQQQRLCIARTIAIKPEIILMDEPCSALDPIATAKIEELIWELSNAFTIIVVTHSMQQAARISELTAFFYMGKLVEFGSTKKIFTIPSQKQTEDYITGRYG